MTWLVSSGKSRAMVLLLCAKSLPIRAMDKTGGEELVPFGSLAVRDARIHGFASQPYDWFAFVEELRLSSTLHLVT